MQCKNCNAEMPDSAKFCGSCGAAMQSQAINKEVTYNESTAPHTSYSSTSTSDAEHENFLKTWNWGAFMFTWIWGIFNKSYYTFLALIPVFGLVYCFICGANGNRWSWKNKEWKDKNEFIRAQKKWNMFGIAIFSINILLIILMISVISLGLVYDDTAVMPQSENASISTSSNDNQTSVTVDPGSEFIQFVKAGHFDVYPEKTVEDAFEEFFGDPSWHYFKAGNGNNIVEFKGLCMVDNKEIKSYNPISRIREQRYL